MIGLFVKANALLEVDVKFMHILIGVVVAWVTLHILELAFQIIMVTKPTLRERLITDFI